MSDRASGNHKERLRGSIAESKARSSGASRLYGLLGYPVAHSLSAVMHNAAFAALHINAEYKLFSVPPQELFSFFDSFDERNIFGLNVTIPYKEEVLRFEALDTDSFYVQKIKAVNTIVRKDGKWKAFNTDAPGFLLDLKEHIDPTGKKVALVGAGGAAKAVAYTLAESKAQAIRVYDIDVNKGYELANVLKGVFAGFDIQFVASLDSLDIKNKDILINATPIGMKASDPCLVPAPMLHKNLFVYDVIYNPAETKLLADAKKAGAKTSNGLGMLLNQGMLSFEIWTGKTAPKEIMWKALQERIAT